MTNTQTKPRIAVVVPTVPGSRDAVYQTFLAEWHKQFTTHKVELVTVFDGDEPRVVHNKNSFSVDDVMRLELRAGQFDYGDLIFNKNDGVRNLGFAYVARFLPDVEVIITLDDDVLPYGYTIADHLHTLARRVPTSWISTASRFMRGFPYGVRDEAQVVVSHGVWHGVKDYDAPTQLVQGNPDVTFFEGPIPRGTLAPICGMNLAFHVSVLKHVYFAPMGPKVGMDRFADIWMGIYLKRALDEAGLAIYSGGAAVEHERASNVFTNLQKEARGLALNETLWQGDESDPYFAMYAEKRARWVQFLQTDMNQEHSNTNAKENHKEDVSYGPGGARITTEGVQLPGEARVHPLSKVRGAEENTGEVFPFPESVAVARYGCETVQRMKREHELKKQEDSAKSAIR